MDSGPIANACFLPTSSVVDIVTRQGTGRTGIQIPAGDFPHSQIAYTGSGAHAASYLWVPVCFFGLKRAGLQFDHSHLSSA